MNTFMDRVNAIVQNNQTPMAQNVSYPGAGIGALENVVSGAPRQTVIGGQPHMLAYINPEEEQMLYAAGGSGDPGPGGIPAFSPRDYAEQRTGTGAYASNMASTGGNNNSAEEQAYLANAAAAAKKAATPSYVDDTFGSGNIYTETTPGASTVNFGNTVTYGNDDSQTTYSSGLLNSNTATQIVQPQSSVQGDFRKDYSYLNNDNFFANDLTTGGNTIGYSFGTNGVGGGVVAVNLNGGYDVSSLDNSRSTNYNTLDEAMDAVKGNPESLNSTQKALRAGFDRKKDLGGVQVATNSLVTNDASGNTGSNFDEIDDGTGTDFSLFTDGVTEEIKKGDDLGALPVIEDPKTVSANSLYETLANVFTPFDDTSYKDGNLIDNKTNELATNVGTKTYYGTVGQANDPNTGVKTNPDMVNLQTRQDEKGIFRDTFDTVLGGLPSTVAGALAPGAGVFLTLAKTLGQYQVGPNPKDVMTGTGKDGQDIFKNADGRYYSKGILGNYYFVGGADGNDPTDSTPISESDPNMKALDDIREKNEKSNNQSAVSLGASGTNATAANKLFNRYYKSGSGYGLPPWLAKYASGKSIDKILAKTTINGKDYYETPDGQFIDASELDPNLVNAIVSPET